MKKEPVEKIQDFLNEAFLILKDGKVKKFAPTTLASKTGAQPSVAKVCGPDFMGIYQTDEQGLYFWNAAYRPDEALAERLD